MFHVETEREREEWVAAIKYVADRLAAISDDSCQDVEMSSGMSFSEMTDNDLSAKFTVQGTSTSKSTGKKKVTLENFEFLKVI